MVSPPPAFVVSTASSTGAGSLKLRRYVPFLISQSLKLRVPLSATLRLRALPSPCRRLLPLVAVNFSTARLQLHPFRRSGMVSETEGIFSYLLLRLIDIILDWKEIVDEWVKATAIVGSEGIPDSVNPSVVYEEEGLPSPPMDEGAFLVASTGSIELSQFFDGMIDIGNPPQNGQNEPTVKPSRPVAADSGPGRPPKSSMQPKSNVEPKAGEEVENGTVTMKPPVDQQAKSKYLEEVAARIEAAKKNLREKRDGGAEKRNARGSNFDVL
ncbi:hypothetical protein Ahy_B06g085325 [Arachis hypogaea]|uniref:Uncharacterized protein n=1 Tax=Arachis hypogaea TaxID=3818 RepID=A0A444YU70_ARAHY|nr:hypothetical protein Ahy_B06g085325 [Arachis hypogaea]